MNSSRNVISLFSSAGIGELGVDAAGLNILVSNELLPDRCSIYQENHPGVTNICGDIWEKEAEIIHTWNEKTSSSPFLMYATPP